MSRQASHQVLILCAAATMCFTGLGSTHLWDKDETLYSTCAREMFQRHDWVVPTFNDRLFPDKPPLMYWLMITSFELFGVSEFATRCWSAAFGVATALLTYHIGRLLFRPEVGFWAGLAVTSNIIFAVSARAATVDSALTFCTTLGMLALIAGIRTCTAHERSSAPTQTWPAETSSCSPSWPSLLLLYATMGLGLLAKGPIGLILPMASAGLFVLILSARQRVAKEFGPSAHSFSSYLAHATDVLHPRNVWRTAWKMHPITAVLVVSLIAAPWYVWVGIRTDGEWLQKFFIEQNVQRALRTLDNHGGTLFYYFLAISVGFFPWSVFMPGALIQLVRCSGHGGKQSTSYLLLACWIGVYVGFWSLVSTKLPHYVLPAYPAIALMTAAFIQERVIGRAESSLLWTRYAVVWLLLIGVAMAVTLPLVASTYVPGEEWLGLLSLIPLAAGIWCLIWFERMRPRLAMSGFVVTSLALGLAIFTIAAQRVDRHQTAESILNSLRARGDDTRNLVAHRYLQESYVFYAGHAVPYSRDLKQLDTLLTDRPHRQVLTTSDQLESIAAAYPGRFSTVARMPRFLNKGDVLVLAQTPRPSVDPSAIDQANRRGAHQSGPDQRKVAADRQLTHRVQATPSPCANLTSCPIMEFRYSESIRTEIKCR